jgi:hypothetical protein
MRRVFVLSALAMVIVGRYAGAQGQPTVEPAPKAVTLAQLKQISSFQGQLVQIDALVRHTDTPQLFTFGEKQGLEVHVVVPYPAIDSADVGDTVAITGFVRRFDGSDFEKDYVWFRKGDYPDLHAGDWVIVATSVRTSQGTQLVPSGVISNTPPESLKGGAQKPR